MKNYYHFKSVFSNIIIKILGICLIIFLILFFIQCNDRNNFEENSYYHSKLKLNYKLVQNDSLMFRSKEPVFIGIIGQVYTWDKYILIQDLINCNVHIFNVDLEYFFTIGKKGSGPGEYVIPPVNVLCKDTSKLFLLDSHNRKINVYDSNFNFISENQLPSDFYYSLYPTVKTNDKYIFCVAFPFSISSDDYYKKYKPLIAIDEDFQYLNNFFNWDDIYFNERYKAYTRNNFSTNLTIGDQDAFYAQQQASFIVHKFDNQLKQVKSFGIEPKYFDSPPTDISTEQTQKNLENFYDFKVNTTSFRNIDYDSTSARIFVCYKKFSKEGLVNRNSLLDSYYLQIYDKNFDCIFDDQVPGKYLFVRNGHLYILTDETESNFKVKIYELKEISNEIY